MTKKQHGSSDQKTTSTYPGTKDKGIKDTTTPSTSKKMDRSLDDDNDDDLNPVDRNNFPDDHKDIDDIVVREDNFDEDVKDYHAKQENTEEESNEDL